MDRKKVNDTIMIGATALYIFYYVLVLSTIIFDYKTFTVTAIALIIFPFVIFILFVMLVSRLLVAGTVNKRNNKRLISLSIIAPIVCFVCLGIFADRATFTSEKWEHEPSERVKIIDHFLNNTELISKTREEIISLLGEPNEDGYFVDDMNMVYYLGPERSLISIDIEWLVIWMEDNQA